MAFEVLVAVLAVGIALPAAWMYNRLVAERNQARQGYADIDVQLKRRAELVPRLVEAVKAYAGYEKALLAAVTELRGQALQATMRERFPIEKALGDKLQQVLVLQEAYPQLKADAGFRDLAAQLVATEDQLQYARRFYNGAVKQYLTRLESFPDLVIARLAGFRPLPFFEL